MSGTARLAVIGLGAISGYYLAAAERSPHWELAAVCDARESRLAPHRGRVPCWTDAETMLREAEPDGVVVAVPNDAHRQVCASVLAAGVPVCVEKPLALTPEEGKELVAEAERHGVALFTAFHRRYNEAVLALRRSLDGGPPVRSLRVRYLERIEEHLGGETWYLDPGRCGGGCVADNGPNAFDLVRLFAGDVEVTGAEVRRDADGTDRQARIGLRAADGVRATVELDWSHPGETKDVEVELADGRLLSADMLAGHHGFKSSLWHEYEGILADFATACAAPLPGHRAHGGLDCLELVAAAYAREEPYGPAPAGSFAQAGGRP
ncbi:Gfo/Idh/MocA family oxidoreductase [Streptomyces sp. HNM0574]|uniref:Gfo/Idh/MocA family protein n=1 Tax=Streptomyces sp. HNM0574 TaxID=2714954 RepID=UPI00146E4645|nr:Gfo/Idh/MocA family oxidoreductase [Streptomyces sp. HNM0574]NLU68135.1 Gfo/Idh/MocA family oxidoreductase [Streptomyces sp. HNM0574]